MRAAQKSTNGGRNVYQCHFEVCLRYVDHPQMTSEYVVDGRFYSLRIRSAEAMA